MKNWSTTIQSKLLWARYKIIVSNEHDAEKAIKELHKDLEDTAILALATMPAYGAPKAKARKYLNDYILPALMDFSREVRDAVVIECIDAANQISRASRAAILGHSVRSAVREAQDPKKARPGGAGKDLEYLLGWTDPPEADIADVMTEGFLGTALEEWAEDIPPKTMMVLNTEFTQALIAGEAMDQIAKRVQGVLNRPMVSANRMARTAIQAASNKMQRNVYTANKDLLRGEKRTATLDLRTCDECGAEDGKVYPVGQGPPLPAHIDCR